MHAYLCSWYFLPETLETRRGSILQMHREAIIKKALEVPGFRVLILEPARFTLCRTTSVAQGGSA